MTPVSEAVERAIKEVARRRVNGVCADDLPSDPQHWSGEALASIIAADHARLTEQVRVAREGLERIRENDPSDPAQPWTVARETLTRMEKNDGQ